VPNNKAPKKDHKLLEPRPVKALSSIPFLDDNWKAKAPEQRIEKPMPLAVQLLRQNFDPDNLPFALSALRQLAVGGMTYFKAEPQQNKSKRTAPEIYQLKIKYSKQAVN